MKEIFLNPGEYHVGRADCRIRTVLGSCVSITLWHPRLRVGAMSHFLLSSRGPSQDGPLDARYAADALSLMLRDLMDEQVNPRECEAKLFGGGSMFVRPPVADSAGIGRQNVEAARMLVRAQSIPIVSESLLGFGYREVIFDVASGHVWSRQARVQAGRASGVL
jgi:chemotaxis protein CheD